MIVFPIIQPIHFLLINKLKKSSLSLNNKEPHRKFPDPDADPDPNGMLFRGPFPISPEEFASHLKRQNMHMQQLLLYYCYNTILLFLLKAECAHSCCLCSL